MIILSVCYFLDWSCGDIVKVLNYISITGSLDFDEVENATKVKNVTKLLEGLRSSYNCGFAPYLWHEKLGHEANFIYSLFFLKKRIDELSLYYLIAGLPMTILRDPLNPNLVLLGGFQVNDALKHMLMFIEYMDLIKIYWTKKEVWREQFIIDYSTFNFQKGEFDENGIILNKMKEPINKDEEPKSSFEPDWFDVAIVGKMQETGNYSIQEISKMLNIPQEIAEDHYKKHIIGQGILRNMYVQLGNYDFRISLFYHENEKFEKEVKRISTLLFNIHLEDGTVYSSFIVPSSTLSTVLDFLYTKSNELDVSYETYIHPLKPKFKYVFAASIPYEHFDPITNRWRMDPQMLIHEVKDKVLPRLAKELGLKDY